jgi:hypothetical protein
MTSTETHPVYVVVGTYGDKIQYWAAAVSRRRAAQEVRNVLGPEWKTSVLDWRLTPERLAKLKLKRNSVRKIGFAQAIRKRPILTSRSLRASIRKIAQSITMSRSMVSDLAVVDSTGGPAFHLCVIIQTPFQLSPGGCSLR